MKQASITFMAAALFFAVNLEQCAAIPKVPEGYQESTPTMSTSTRPGN